MPRQRTIALCDAHVAKQFEPWGEYPFADGLTALQHARQHRANMSPERRAELDGEWE